MEDARIAAQGLELLGNAGRAADAHDQVLAQALMHVAGRVARAHAQQIHLAVAFFGQHLDDFLAVDAAVLELGGSPGQVVVELVAAGEEGLEVDEVLQPALFVQVVDEGEAAGGIAQRGQVLEEGHLHVGLLQQHVPVPGEARLLFDEDGVHGPRGGFALLEGDGQGNVGGAEADADQRVGLHGRSFHWVGASSASGAAASVCGIHKASAKKRSLSRTPSTARLCGKSNSLTSA